MDFDAVPANTPPAQALVLRGADPDICYPPGHRYHTMCGVANAERNLAGGQHAVFYSDIAGEIVNYMFASDAAVLGGLITDAVPLPLQPHGRRLRVRPPRRA